MGGRTESPIDEGVVVALDTLSLVTESVVPEPPLMQFIRAACALVYAASDVTRVCRAVSMSDTIAHSSQVTCIGWDVAENDRPCAL